MKPLFRMGTTEPHPQSWARSTVGLHYKAHVHNDKKVQFGRGDTTA